MKCDVYCRRTRDDLFYGDRDLLGTVCRKLGDMPVYRLEIRKAQTTGDSIRVNVRTFNLERLECYVNGLPQRAIPAQPPQQSFSVPIEWGTETTQRDSEGIRTVPARRRASPDCRGSIEDYAGGGSLSIHSC